ncbi:MAG: GNAT family N-acetyltransferase [Terrimicrobiaceae bacterium]
MKYSEPKASNMKFYLHIEEIKNILVIRGVVKNRNAGHLFGYISENEMQLNDLFLPECVAYPLLPCLGALSPKIRLIIRNRGIGTAMLKTAVKRARFLGANRVVGWITENDLQASPFLLSWYRRLGFRVAGSSHGFPSAKSSTQIYLSEQDF